MVSAAAIVQVQAQQAQQIAQLSQIVRGVQQMAVGGQILLDEKAKDQEFWDNVYLLSALRRQKTMAFRTNIFTNGPQTGQAKTKAEFNLPVPGTFPAPQEYAIHGIRYQIMGAVEDGARPAWADIEQIRAFCTLSYFQGQRELWQWPLDKFSDAGFYGAANAVADGGELNFGPAGMMDFEPFSAPLAQVNGLGFGWQIASAEQMQLSADVRMKVTLVGQLVTTAR